MDTSSFDSLVCLARELPLHCSPPTELLPITCLDKVRRALMLGCNQLGYEYVRYSYWLKNVVPRNETTNAFSVNFSNFPITWETFYNQQHLYLHDPVVRIIQEKMNTHRLMHGSWGDTYLWAVQNPLGESEAQKQDYLQKINKLIADAQKHKLASGYYYCWGDSVRQIVLSLATGTSVNNKAEGFTINALHGMMVLVNQSIMDTQGCQSCNKSLRIDGSTPIKLSKTEIHILNLYNKHKSASQKHIAEQCSRTIDTVNHHLRSIRQKLKVPGASGHALAAYASELNLL
jgi:DNA-binding CsgD family transcriptional regulator